MKINKIIEAIKGLDFDGKDILVKGIEDYKRELSDENKTLRKTHESAIHKILDLAGADKDTGLDEVFEKLSNTSNEKSDMAKQIAKMDKELKITNDKYAAQELKLSQKTRDEAINSALSKAGVRKETMTGLKDLFAAQSKQDDAGDWVIGDSDIETGVNDYVKKNDYFLYAGQVAGSGNTAPNNGNSTSEYLSQADVIQMTSAERTANMPKIKESMAKAKKENKEW